ncbi:MAG: hypothetical protein AB4426_33630 [Xenococcaceae cyanobacterium]
MNLETSQIDLDSIQVNQKFPAFNPDQLLYLANSIANLEGLLRIPVVRQLDIENYELVSGFFEYQAYLKAREINPELPDRLRVFVAKKENEVSIQQQIEALERLEEVSPPTETGLPPDWSISISNLFSAIDGIKQDLRTTIEQTIIQL